MLATLPNVDHDISPYGEVGAKESWNVELAAYNQQFVDLSVSAWKLVRLYMTYKK